jgi:DNA-binding NarL/FixJ family response regulator
MCQHRVLLVHHCPRRHQAVGSILTASGDIRLVGSARSGREALERAGELGPDLVLTDLVMPGTDGLELTRRLGMLPRRPKVIIMTAHRDEAYRQAALRAGADAFLREMELPDRLVPIIRDVLAGRVGDGDPFSGHEVRSPRTQPLQEVQ